MSTFSSLTTRNDKKESSRGAALLEFALVIPVIVALVMGIIEYGNLWRQVGSLERAAHQSARVVAAQANGRFADFEALRAVDAVTRGMSGITVERVIIYRATEEDGKVPDECLSAAVAGTCNIYTGAQVQTVSPVGFPSGSLSNPTCAAGSWDSSWCPVTRPRSELNPVRVGVHLTVQYESVTGFFPGAPQRVERNAVFQIEPCAQGQSEC